LKENSVLIYYTILSKVDCTLFVSVPLRGTVVVLGGAREWGCPLFLCCCFCCCGGGGFSWPDEFN